MKPKKTRYKRLTEFKLKPSVILIHSTKVMSTVWLRKSCFDFHRRTSAPLTRSVCLVSFLCITGACLPHWLRRGHPPGCGRWYAPSPRHLQSLLSAGGGFFMWSFVVLFLSCRVVCCSCCVFVCVTCFASSRPRVVLCVGVCCLVLVVSCSVLFLLCVCVCDLSLLLQKHRNTAPTLAHAQTILYK